MTEAQQKLYDRVVAAADHIRRTQMRPNFGDMEVLPRKTRYTKNNRKNRKKLIMQHRNLDRTQVVGKFKFELRLRMNHKAARRMIEYQNRVYAFVSRNSTHKYMHEWANLINRQPETIYIEL